MEVKRYDLLNHLIDTYGFINYLEIGVWAGECIKNVKAEHKQCLCTVEKANWFLKEIPENYEKMEHDVMNYDWGREIIIYFKY